MLGRRVRAPGGSGGGRPRCSSRRWRAAGRRRLGPRSPAARGSRGSRRKHEGLCQICARHTMIVPFQGSNCGPEEHLRVRAEPRARKGSAARRGPAGAEHLRARDSAPVACQRYTARPEGVLGAVGSAPLSRHLPQLVQHQSGVRLHDELRLALAHQALGGVHSAQRRASRGSPRHAAHSRTAPTIDRQRLARVAEALVRRETAVRRQTCRGLGHHRDIRHGQGGHDPGAANLLDRPRRINCSD